MPTDAVDGVGAITDPIPAVGKVYHFKVLPALAPAVRASALAF